MANVTLNFEQAKAYGAQLEGEVSRLEKALKALEGDERTPMGLTPAHIKATPEWQATKKAFGIAFSNLRNFNGQFVKHFKKELKLERDAKIAARSR